MDFVGGLICVGLALGAIVLVVYKLATNPGKERIDAMEARIRDLAHRVASLERTASEKTADVRPAATPTPVKSPPHRETPTTVPVAVAPPRRSPDVPPPLPAVPAPTVPTPVPATPRAPAVVVRPAPEPSRPILRTQQKSAPSLEAFLGGRVMLIVGVVVGLLGIAFFLKYAIDRGWLVPGARIAMGVTAGLALLFGGEKLRRRGFDVFGQALMGFGLGALYLSNYFACSVYDMIEPSAAFTMTAAITAAGAVLALSRGAPVLAYLGFLGGYLAPWLLSKTSGDLVGLTTWLVVLDAGLLAVLLRRAWHGLDLMALVATSVYFAAWFVRHAVGAELATTGACLAGLVAASLVLGLAPSIARRERLSGQSLVGVAAAGALAVIAGHELFFPAHRFELGAGVVLLGAAYYLASTLIAKRVAEGRPESESLMGFAAASLATAVAVVFSGNAVSPALSVAGLAVVFAGTRTRQGVLLACGVGTIALACGDLLLNRLDMFDVAATPFLNERFFVFACPFVALLVAGKLMSKTEGVTPATATLVAAAGLLLLPVVVAGDLYRGFAPTDAMHRELRYVAPAAALAVYGVLAARLFGRGSTLGRALAFAPVIFALFFGVTLMYFGHVRSFAVALNPTFLAGLLIVAAARFAARDDETGARNSLGVVAAVFLLALVTAEIHAWGETCDVADLGGRGVAQFAAREWTVIAWTAFASALALAEAARRWKPLAWIGIGHVAAERALALFSLIGAAGWLVVVHVERYDAATWMMDGSFHWPVKSFANLVFVGGLALAGAAHVVGRAPFDSARRFTRLAGLVALLVVVTIEIRWWGDRFLWTTAMFDADVRPAVDFDVLSWTTLVWAAFAGGVAGMGLARKVPALRWLGVDDDVLEGRVAVVPLVGAALWGIAAMVHGRSEYFTPVFNLAFVGGLAVAASAFAVSERCRGARGPLQIGALVWLVALVAAEIHGWGQLCDPGAGTRAEAEFRAVVWISIAWAVYAAALVGLGFRQKREALRWVGLGVFALTVGKVFLVDLAQLEAVYRIGSFLVLGAFLVGASFLYQRARRSDGTVK